MKKNAYTLFFLIAFALNSFSQNPLMWATASDGQAIGTLNGSIFIYNPNTNAFGLYRGFGNPPLNGSTPKGDLVLASNNFLYGMTSTGGVNSRGVLFKINKKSPYTYTKILDFDGSINGSNPEGNLIEVNNGNVSAPYNGKLFGMTSNGGVNGLGVLFELDTATGIVTKKIDFDSINGSNPKGSLFQAANGKLYGLTEFGGINNDGVLFEYDIVSNNLTVKFNFNGTPKGSNPKGSLIQADNGLLYGMTYRGGSFNRGTIFSYNIDANNLTRVFNFKNTTGNYPQGSLLQVADTLYGMTSRGGVSNFGTLFAHNINTNSQTIKHSFGVTPNGRNPSGNVIEYNGFLYGLTPFDNNSNIYGTLFKIKISNSAFTSFPSTGGGLGAAQMGSLIFSPPCFNTFSSRSLTACDSIISPSGNYTWYNSGTYTDIIPNSLGCDSVITIIATINTFPSSNLSISILDQVSCAGANDGKLKANIITSTNPPYNFIWNNAVNTAINNGLLSGTYSVIARDGNGCMAYDTIFLGVLDTIKPTAITQNDTIYLNALGSANVSISAIDNGSNDNCGGTSGIDSTSLSKTSFSCADIGNNTVYLKVFDASGNRDSASAIVTVVDTIKPIAIPKNNYKLYLDVTGNVSLTAAGLDSISSDNCSIVSIILSKTSFNCSNVGNNSVSFRVVDGSSNDSIVLTNVIVIDSIKPLARVKNIYTAYLDILGSVSVSANDVDSLSNDSCGIDTLILRKTSFDCTNIGLNSIKFIAKDINGNADSTTAVVEILDTIAPTANVQNATLYLNNINGKVNFDASGFNNGSIDNCGIDTIQVIPDNFDCSNVGANTVILRVRDVNGNITITSATAFVLDTIKPKIINCPANIVEYATSTNCTATVIWPTITAVDTCGVDSLVSNFPSGFTFSRGTTVVQYIAYDPSMNTDTCSFTVTIIDTISPIISNVPANIVQNNDVGQCSAVVNWLALAANDNCVVNSLVGNFASGASFPVGTTIVQYIATDASMNTDTIQFTVTINDLEKPKIVCQADTTVCSAIVNYSIPTATDNCSGVTLTRISGLASGSTFPIGTTTIMYEVVDASNNKDTCSFDITVLQIATTPFAGKDTAICDNQLKLNANTPSVGNGLWTAVNGSVNFADPTDSKTIVSGLSIGNNTLIWSITNGNCVPLRDTIIIKVFGNPMANAGADISLCDGKIINLNATAANVGNGIWTVLSGSANFVDATLFNTSANGFTRGTNQLVWTVITANCGSAADTLNIIYGDKLIADAGEDKTIFVGGSTQLNVTANDIIATYLWTPTTGLNNAFIQNPIASPITSTDYIVNVIATSGCTGSDTVSVKVSEFLTIPTAFTPNNDGFNDTWKFENLFNIDKVEVVVYNNFGNKVYQSKDYLNDNKGFWDGTYNGELLAVGSYYWIINLYKSDGEKEMINGIVSILR